MSDKPHRSSDEYGCFLFLVALLTFWTVADVCRTVREVYGAKSHCRCEKPEADAK